MSKLPEWTKNRAITDRLFCQQLYDALVIAWEALNRYAIANDGCEVAAKDAMRRIEEL